MATTATTTAASKAKITLHWLEKSRSQRILWLIHELSIPDRADFTLKTYKRGSDMLAEKALKDVHPLGKSPVITVEAASGPFAGKSRVIAESGTIVEYLCEHYGGKNGEWIPKRYPSGSEGGVGEETEEWLRYAQFMQYAEGSLMSLLVLGLVVQNLKDGPQVPFFAKPLTRAIGGRIETAFLNRNFDANFAFVESQLATSPDGGQYLCGPNITGVDVLMEFPLGAARSRAGLTKEKYPKIWAYLDMLQARPAYKKAVQQIVDQTGSYDSSL